MKYHDLRFAIYARVSTEAQEDQGQSLATQESMMREHVARMGGTVAHVYRVQESAMPGEERTSLSQLLSDAAKGSCDAVMVCKLDRLARDIQVFTHVENHLRDFGILLFEGAEEHNLRSAEGTRGMQALIGEYSVNRLKWAACASRLERAQRGWPHSGLLPYGRCFDRKADKRTGNAVWFLDPAKAKLAADMYGMYVDEHANLAQVGKRFGTNPETVRRIFMEQGGSVWKRDFVDPVTGKRVQVETPIPPLFTDAQIERLRERAKQNQLERAQWVRREREYPLSLFVRCSNPECGWSNLSGHQTKGQRLVAYADGTTAPVRYPYYLHLARNRKEGCLHSVPAEMLEDEIFSRLGQFLRDSKQLEAAIRAALITNPAEIAELKRREAELRKKAQAGRRILENALEVVFEHKGTPAGLLAQAKVGEQNKALSDIDQELARLGDTLKVVEIPADFPKKFSQMMRRLTGLHGHVPMLWPTNAKRTLLRIFFGGLGSTRFDREGKHVRSCARGIFVSKKFEPDGTGYWTYEVRGVIGSFEGALTRVVELYDRHHSEETARDFTKEELAELAALTPQFEGLINFRSSPDASTPKSASRCRGTSPRCKSSGSGHPER
jgi:DNA invertase Pin-like site-specific DNA recombinase